MQNRNSDMALTVLMFLIFGPVLLWVLYTLGKVIFVMERVP